LCHQGPFKTFQQTWIKKPPKYLDYGHIKNKKLMMETWKGGKVCNIYEGLWAKHYKIKDLEGQLDVL
jgi:hypothetical protein